MDEKELKQIVLKIHYVQLKHRKAKTVQTILNDHVLSMVFVKSHAFRLIALRAFHI